MLRRRSIVLLAVLMCGCGGASRVGGPPEQTRTLTLLNPIDDVEDVVPFVQEVDRLSHGRLRIRVARSPHLDRTDFEQAAIADVRAGRYDLGWAGSRAWNGSLRALNAPLLVDSYALQERIASDPLASRMLGELQPLGLVGLGILPGPMRRPFGVHGRLIAPHDFRGLAIGEQQSAVAAATLRALGADPVASNVSSTMKRLDGVERQLVGIYGDGLDVAGSHVAANVELWPRPLVLFANADALEKLSNSEREILRAAAASAITRSAEQQRDEEREIAGNLCRNGQVAFDTASAADLRALRAAVVPVYRDLERDPPTRDALAAIAALKREVAAPPATLPACAGSAAPQAASRTPLDGTWQMDTGRSASAPDFLDENWGHWVFVFDRGRFAITQENRTSCTWGYGTFAVEDGKTTWRFTDGGGDAPNGATNKPGEEFSYRLSLFRGTATLGPVKGAVSPANFDPEPWRKLGPPSRARLSRRCPPPAEALAR